ncbi:DUF2059 domain-containing protein [Sphingorhabdus sp.]|uniref:DUF2059 domain-containing protein n=1 Tax=Sphingorhabdus sp. TaxID=1902408 RepID=UPI003919F8AD
MRINQFLLTMFTGLCFAFAFPAVAESYDQKLNDARAIVVASNYENSMNLMMANLMPATEENFIAGLGKSFTGIGLLVDIDAKYPGGRAAFGKRFGQIFSELFRKRHKQIIEEAARLYANEFTAAELATIRSFMESPVGRKMNEATPRIQQSLAQIGRKFGEQAGSEAAGLLLDEAERYLGEIK